MPTHRNAVPSDGFRPNGQGQGSAGRGRTSTKAPCSALCEGPAGARTLYHHSRKVVAAGVRPRLRGLEEEHGLGGDVAGLRVVDEAEGAQAAEVVRVAARARRS